MRRQVRRVLLCCMPLGQATGWRLYNPKRFREERAEVIFEMIDRISFRTMVTVTASGVSASHVPMLVDRDAGEHGTVLGHIARGEPPME